MEVPSQLNSMPPLMVASIGEHPKLHAPREARGTARGAKNVKPIMDSHPRILSRSNTLLHPVPIRTLAALCAGTQQSGRSLRLGEEVGVGVRDQRPCSAYHSSVFFYPACLWHFNSHLDLPRISPRGAIPNKLAMDTDSSIQNLLVSPKSSTFEQNPSPNTHDGVPKDWKFWCIIFSLALSVLLTAVEFVSHLLLRFIFFSSERCTHAVSGYKTYRLELGQRYRRSSAT